MEMTSAKTTIEQLTDLLPGDAREQHFYEGYYGFTNGHIAGLIPKHRLDCQVDKPLDYSGVFKGITPVKDVIYTLSELESALSAFKTEEEIKHEYEECPECKGECEIECECCGQYSDCERCDGHGELLIRSTKTERIKYITIDGHMIIKSAIINPNLVAVMIDACKMLGISDKLFVLTHNSERRASIFEVDDCKFIIMPIEPGTESVKISI